MAWSWTARAARAWKGAPPRRAGLWRARAAQNNGCVRRNGRFGSAARESGIARGGNYQRSVSVRAAERALSLSWRRLYVREQVDTRACDGWILFFFGEAAARACEQAE